MSQNAGLYLFFPNGFVWLSIYFFFLHVVLLALGFTNEDVPKMLAPLSGDPSVHFGTFFFFVFFPLMAFYLYITQTGGWDKTALR
jgi:hypothetical protein